MIAGGYGTGRELVEFFLSYGPVGGLWAMALNTAIWCAVCVVTFEIARATRTYEYRGFSRHLLGPSWFLYDICYLVTMIVVLSVIAAAAGSILEESFHLPYLVGVVGVMACVGVLVFKGAPAIERFLSIWSFVLYAAYIVFLVCCLSLFGGEILSNLAKLEARPNWYVGGFEYAAYNVGTLPAVLFSMRHLERRKEAVGAGLLAGPIAMLPGLFFYLAMVGQYPAVLERTVPSIYLLDLLGSRAFFLLFQIVLLGTLIETGTALIHAFNDRIASAVLDQGRSFPPGARPALGVGLLLLGAAVAQFGLEDLIAKGYGTVTYGFWFYYLIPVLALGFLSLKRGRLEPSPHSADPSGS